MIVCPKCGYGPAPSGEIKTVKAMKDGRILEATVMLIHCGHSGCGFFLGVIPFSG